MRPWIAPLLSGLVAFLGVVANLVAWPAIHTRAAASIAVRRRAAQRRTGRRGTAREAAEPADDSVATAAPPRPTAAAPLLRAAPDVADRRAHDRMPLDRGAMLWLSGRAAVAANLLDLSEGGAALEWPDAAPPVGAEGTLVVDTAALAVRVVRAADGRIGLAFAVAGPDVARTVQGIVARTAVARAA